MLNQDVTRHAHSTYLFLYHHSSFHSNVHSAFRSFDPAGLSTFHSVCSLYLPLPISIYCGLMKLCRRYKSVIAKRPVHLNSKTVHLFQTRVGVIWSTDVFVECVQLGPQSFPVRGAAEVVLPGLACNVMRPLLPGGSRRSVLSRCTHKCTII